MCPVTADTNNCCFYVGPELVDVYTATVQPSQAHQLVNTRTLLDLARIYGCHGLGPYQCT